MAEGEWGGALQVAPIKVKISIQTGLNVMQTGFHVRPVGLTTGDPDEVTAAVNTWCDTHLKTVLSPLDKIIGIDAVDLVSALGHSISPANMIGTANTGGVEAPSFLAMVVSLKGERRTRYGQGRMFLPMRNENWTDKEVLTGAGTIAYQAVLTGLSDVFMGNDANGYNLVNVHGVIPARPATTTRPVRPEVPPMWHDVTSLRLNTVLTFLRSRKAGVGS